MGPTEGRTRAIVSKSSTADLKFFMILHDRMTYIKLSNALISYPGFVIQVYNIKPTKEQKNKKTSKQFQALFTKKNF